MTKNNKYKLICIITLFMMFIIGSMVTNISALSTGNIKKESNLNSKTVNSDGIVSIDIPTYDPAVGWIPGEVKNAKISVNFGAAQAPNKTLKIKLPEGMRYVTYPMKGANVSKGEIEAPGNLAAIIASNTGSQKYEYAPSYTGELVYNFISGTEKTDEVTIGIAVDENLYYGPKVFTGDSAIVVSSSVNGIETGNTTMDVNAVNNGTIGFLTTSATNVPKYTNSLGSTTLVTAVEYLTYRNGFLSPKYLYSKSVKSKFYYPIGAKVTDVKMQPGATYVDYPEEGYVEVTTVGHYSFYPTVGLILDTSALPLGIHQNPNKKQSVEITMYDDTVMGLTTPITESPIITIIEEAPKMLTIKANSQPFKDIASDFNSINTYGITNDFMTVKKNQVLEINIGQNYQAQEITFPKDIIKSIRYKTNINSDFTTFDITKLKPDLPDGTTLALNGIIAGLADNEYLTFIEAELEDLSTGYTSIGSSNIGYQYNNARIIGRLIDGINSENITIRTYEKGNDDLPVNDSISTNTLLVKRATELKSGFAKVITETKMLAGTTSKNVKLYIKQSGYIYNASDAMISPSIFIKVPDGVTYVKDSFKLSIGGETQAIDFSISDKFEVENGDSYIRIDVKHPIGGYFGSVSYSSLTLTFDIKTNLFANGNYKWSDLAFLMDGSHKTLSGIHQGEILSTADINDLDQDGDKVEMLMPFNPTNFIITPDRNLLIDTYIKPSADAAREVSFDVSKPNTAINFTPGTNAIYNVAVYNNREDKIAEKSNLTAYIPVPKDNMDFGTDFQSKPFNWDMKLSNTVVPVIKVYSVDPTTGIETDISATKAANYELSYTSGATNESNYIGATYSTTMSVDTTMIKLTNTDGIDMQEKAIVEFVYIVDETPASVQGTDKLGTINDFMPYYRYESAGAVGWLNGARVGANLVIGEISGKVFKDIDGTGTLTNDDTNLGGIDVTLFKKDATNKYVPYIDPNTSIQMKATTATDGTYKFINLPNGDFKIDFSSVVNNAGVFTPIHTGTDYKIDSDVIHNGTGVGNGINIDPTLDTSKYIYAGLLAYNPPVDLKLSADKNNVSVKTGLDGIGIGTSASVTLTIIPDFFATILDKTYDSDGIKWVSADESIATVGGNGNLTSDTNGGLTTVLNITGLKIGATVITATIQDQYGQNREVTISVTVTSNTKPVINVGDTFVEFGSAFDSLAIISANDNEDGPILKSKIKVSGSVYTNVPGPQTVTYEVTDLDGNKTTKDVIYYVGTSRVGNVVFYGNDFSVTEKEATSITEEIFKTKSQIKAWSTIDQSEVNVSTPNLATELVNKPVGIYDVSVVAGTSSSIVKVTVTDSTNPIISTDTDLKEIKLGSASKLDANDLRLLFNVQATDNVDKSIAQSDISVVGSVDHTKTGSTKIKFQYTDLAGNKAEKEVELKINAVVLSGVVFADTSFDNTNNSDQGIADVVIKLVNAETNNVLAQTTTNPLGQYSFALPIGSEALNTKYVIIPEIKDGYTLANYDSSIIGSKIDVDTNKSDVKTISGVDYTDVNIGFGPALYASLAPEISTVYVADTITNSLILTNGEVVSEVLSNENIAIKAVTGGYEITGLIPGTSKLTVNIKDGYGRVGVKKEVSVNVIALPSILTLNKTMIINETYNQDIIASPEDVIKTFNSSNIDVATIDGDGKVVALKRGSSNILSTVTTNDAAAKKASANSIISVGLEKYPTTSDIDVIDSVDFKILRSKLKNISLTDLIANGQVAAWSIEKDSFNNPIDIIDAKLSDVKPILSSDAKAKKYSKTEKSDPNIKYVTYITSNGTEVVSTITIIDEVITDPKPVGPITKTGSNYITYAFMVISIASSILVIELYYNKQRNK